MPGLRFYPGMFPWALGPVLGHGEAMRLHSGPEVSGTGCEVLSPQWPALPAHSQKTAEGLGGTGLRAPFLEMGRPETSLNTRTSSSCRPESLLGQDCCSLEEHLPRQVRQSVGMTLGTSDMGIVISINGAIDVYH